MRTNSTNTTNAIARRTSDAAIQAHDTRRVGRVAGRATATPAARTYPPHWSHPSKLASKPDEERTPGTVVTAKATTAAPSMTSPARTVMFPCGVGTEARAGKRSPPREVGRVGGPTG